MDVKLPFKGGRMLYAPWSFEWLNEDNATLDPNWPTMTNDMLIQTWVPGDTVYDFYENKGNGPPPPQQPVTKNKVIIPILAVLGALILALLIVISCMWRRHEKAMEIMAALKQSKYLKQPKLYRQGWGRPRVHLGTEAMQTGLGLMHGNLWMRMP